MADLTRVESGERGQILLVAAFILAVTFVTLALVVNSAIFTENLATRDDVAGSHDALEVRYELQENVGNLMPAVNNESLGDDTALRTDMQEGVENITIDLGIQQSTQGRLVNVTYVDETVGTKYAQNESRNFTSAAPSNSINWNLTEYDDFDVRDFTINVTDPSTLSGSTPFRVVVADRFAPVEEWNLTVTEGPNPGETTVEVRHSEHSGVESCTRDHSSDGFVRIDITGGTVGGEPCPALTRLSDGTQMWFGTGVPDTRYIGFRNADNIEGTYSFILDVPMDTASAGFPSASESHPPDNTFDEDALYSVTVFYEFYTASVRYETDIRVAPGEVPP
jgi:hypothetical protein